MKNKKLTYILGLAVVIIWGMIIYRIIQSLKSDDVETIPTTAVKKEPYNDYTVPKETTRLALNYRDPFGLVKFRDTTKTIIHNLPNNQHLVIKPAVNWDFIKYSGYIRNPASKELIALLQINGKSVNMVEGETTDSVKLLKNMQDSVKIRFRGKIKYIPIHHGAL